MVPLKRLGRWIWSVGLVRRNIITSGQTMSRWSFTGCRAGSCRVGRLDAFFGFLSRIVASARLSADQSFFASSDSSASSSDSYSSTAGQTAGLLSAKRNNLAAEMRWS